MLQSKDVGRAGRGVQELAARDGQASARCWHHRSHSAAHFQLCPGVDDERPGRWSAQGSSPFALRRRDRRRPNVHAPRDQQHLRGGPQGQGRRRSRNDENR
eukprot:946185-Pleurochrysis_carterae.AAC.3